MTSENPDVSIVIPVYNEFDNIRPLIAQIEEAFKPLDRSFEVIACDDGSDDGSEELLQELVETKGFLNVVVLMRQSGQSAALDAGFQQARGRYIVTLDGDLQNDPKDIPRLLDCLDNGADYVTGWRRDRQDSFIRTIPSRIANYIIRKVTRTRMHDLGCSLKAYRREIVDGMKIYGEMHRFISVLVESQGARSEEIVVNHRPRVAGRSKYSLNRTVKVLLDLITVWFMISYRSKPIYVFGSFGLLLCLGGLTAAGYTLFEKLVFSIWVHKNPLFMVAILLTVVGVQFIGSGLICEILVRTYFESQSKQAYRIRSTYQGQNRSNQKKAV